MKTTTDGKRWGTIDEAAQHLKVSRDTIRRMISRNEVYAERFGPRAIRVSMDSLDASGKPVGVAA